MLVKIYVDGGDRFVLAGITGLSLHVKFTRNLDPALELVSVKSR